MSETEKESVKQNIQNVPILGRCVRKDESLNPAYDTWMFETGKEKSYSKHSKRGNCRAMREKNEFVTKNDLIDLECPGRKRTVFCKHPKS
jgi:hypothetical protein